MRITGRNERGDKKEKAEKSFRKASLRDHRMKVVNLVKVNTLSMQ